MATYRILSLPSNAIGVTPISGASAWGYGAWVQVSASTATELAITSLSFQITDSPAVDTTTERLFEIGVGASGAEIPKIQLPYSIRNDTAVGYYHTQNYVVYLPEPFVIPVGSGVSVRVVDSIVSALAYNAVKLMYQANTPPVVVLNSPANAETVTDSTPTLAFTGTDIDDDTIEYNVQINTTNTFIDSGVFISLAQTLRAWYGVSIDSSNQNVYATVNGGDIYKQTAGTGSFVALGQTARAWYSISVDSSNQNVYATVNGGDIYKQTAGTGSFVALGQTARAWYSISVDSSNQNVYATVNGGDIYKQTAGTGSFVALSQTARSWAGVSVDSLNQNVYATVTGGDIYKQTAGTGSFVALGETSRIWYGITVDSSNQNVYAVTNSGGGSDDIYKQTAGTGSFVALGETSREWYGISVDRSSQIVYATEIDGITIKGNIYKQLYVPLLLDALSTTDPGFLDITNGGDTHPFASGDQISYTVQAAAILAAGTYYWRVAAKDPLGSNTYGAWAATRSFTVTLGTAGMKVWNGVTWGYKPVKVWNGSSWVVKPVKVWNGSAWVVKG